MKEETEKEMEKFGRNTNNIFKFVKPVKKDGKDIEGGQCIRDNGGRLGLTSTDEKRIW